MSGTISSSALEERIAELSPEEREHLFRRLLGLYGARTRLPELRPRGFTGPAPLSFVQEALWIEEQLVGGPAYLLPAHLRLEGTLEPGGLARALDTIIARHEILRTTFLLHDGQPAQLAHPPARVRLPLVDLSRLKAATRAHEETRILRAEASHCFDLQREAGFRALLLRHTRDSHLLVLTTHHIAMDGWSVALLYDEIGRHYRAWHESTTAAPEPPPIHYADYAAWQRRLVEGGALEQDHRFWVEHLDGAPAVDLPTDRPRTPVLGTRGGSIERPLGREAAREVEAMCRRQGATPFMAMATAFALVLRAHTGIDDICLLTGSAKRGSPATERVLGNFADLLPLRLDLSGRSSFAELLERTRVTLLQIYEHQEYPFLKLVNEVLPGRLRDASHGHLAPGVVHQNFPQVEPDLPGIKASNVPGPTVPEARGEIALGVWYDEMLCHCMYNADLFDQTTVQRMLGHFQRVLVGGTEHPRRTASHIPLLSAAEQHQVLVEWNDTWRPPPRQTVHGALQRIARQHPDQPAALSRDGVPLTHAELDRRSEALAGTLRRRGAGGARVGVCAATSADLAVGALATLRAGGAVIVVDPDARREELRRGLEQRGAHALLDGHQLELLRPAPPRCGGAHPAQLAQMMYGDTRQRGSMTGLPHVALLELADRLDGSIRPGQRVVRSRGCGEEVELLCLWGALLNRASLVDPGEDAAELMATTRDPAGAVVMLPAALWKPLARHGRSWLERGGAVIVCGDALTSQWSGPANGRLTWLLHRAEAPAAAAWDTRNAPPRPGVVPAGRPLPGARVRILDAELRPVPVGVPGELYIGGAGLALGYLDDPATSAARFVPDPWAEEPGARMLRTGEQARWHSDGTLLLLGRAARLDGLAVAPPEIEAVLEQIEGVVQAAVVLETGGPVAYIVPDRPGVLGRGALDRQLRAILPEYKLPVAYHGLDALPLDATGRVDRETLARGSWPEFPDWPADKRARLRQLLSARKQRQG